MQKNIKKNPNISIMTEKYQPIFFSKDIISGLNKTLIQQSNSHNLNREGKQELIKLLVKNMKMVYRSIDITRINKVNFNSIYEQFKKNSINETLNDLKHPSKKPSFVPSLV